MTRSRMCPPTSGRRTRRSNNYDFEYHTEEDEESALLDRGWDDGLSASFENDEGDNAVMLLRSRPAHGSGRTGSFASAQTYIHARSKGVSEVIDKETIDSERALYGTPVKKKEHTLSKPRRGGRRHRHKSRVMIETVNVAEDESRVQWKPASRARCGASRLAPKI